jgi:hypothetical protein
VTAGASVTMERAVLAILIVVYLLLALPITARQGVNWDEQTDLDIAAEYAASRGGLIHGSRIDAINVRLPMYSVALLLAVMPGDDLLVARWVSVLLGAVTLLLVYGAVAACTDRRRAFLTCAILATSPYFIYFSSVALTEGDIWITAATAAFLASASACARSAGSVGGVAAVGSTLGLALSAKISAMALVPVALLVVVYPRLFCRAVAPAPAAEPVSRRVPLAVGVAFLPWLAQTAVLAISQVVGWSLEARLPSISSHPLTRWTFVAVLLTVLLFWCVRRLDSVLRAWESALVMSLTAMLTFFVVPPVHTTNPFILGSLARDLFAAGDGIAWPFVAEATAFHVLVMLLKPGLAVGVALLVAVAVAVARARARPALRLGLFTLIPYAAFLALLPWAQTRYMMPVFPVLAFFAADMLVDAARRRPRAVAAFAVVAAGLLVRDFALTYPDLNLNGYQWTGTRYLAGRSTLGYRAIGTTPSDGVRQALEWTCARAGPGDTVLTFLLEEHIVRSTCGVPGFRRLDGMREPFELSSVDFVVTTINTDIDAGHFTSNPRGEVFKYPHYDRQQLERHFERGFSVQRAFGIEVAVVWIPKRDPRDAR